MARPVNNDHTLHIRLPADLAAKAKAKARRERRPISEVMRDLLRTWLTDTARA